MGNRTGILLVLAALALGVGVWAVLKEKKPVKPSKAVGAKVHLPSIGTATRLSNGLFEIRLHDGFTFTLHGGDPKGLKQIEEAPKAKRSPVCVDDHRMHVLYSNPIDRPNRYSAVMDDIRTYVRQMNRRLYAEGRLSGKRGVNYRVACVGRTLAVDYFQSATMSAVDNFSTIVQSARNAGFGRADEKYEIFYDDPNGNWCGVATLSGDDRRSRDNASNTGPDYAVTYSDCWATSTPMHENGHNMGAVQDTAPHSSGAGHCNDEEDVMCYADGGPKSAVFQRCEREYFDCGHDDYFDTNTEPGEYLSNHWNLGWPGNRFLVFKKR